MFEEINAHLAERGYRVRAGTIVDASIIAAPSSTKNREGARDPEMHQTRKGNEWHFGMKAHIGVDAETGLVHGVRATPANTHDLREAVALLHGGEEEVWADFGVVRSPRARCVRSNVGTVGYPPPKAPQPFERGFFDLRLS